MQDRLELRQREPVWAAAIFAVGFPVLSTIALAHFHAPPWCIAVFAGFLFILGAFAVALLHYWNGQEPIAIFHRQSATIALPRQGLTIPASEWERFVLVPATWREAGESFQAVHLGLDGGSLILYTSLRPRRFQQAWEAFRSGSKPLPSARLL
jgi:hypothetical protein